MHLNAKARNVEDDRRGHVRRRIELWSAVLMAVATIATAWSAYQSAMWNSDYATRKSEATTATIKVAKHTNLAMQRSSKHVYLFAQWSSAVHAGDTALADFLLARFPEPLRTAMAAWLATDPLKNPSAPATPFDMPQYVLPERAEADRWEAVALRESEAAEEASEIANRYLLFTILIAMVLFFAGISGKFGSQAINVAVLALGALTLLIGVAVMLVSPRL